MQSQKSSKAKGQKPLSLPWGFGSMAMHGIKWWLNWRDAEGKPQWRNSNTEDAAEAQRILAELALPRARKMVEVLERISRGEETYQGDSKARRGSGRKRAAGRDRGKTVRHPRKGTGAETAGGGEA